MEATYTISNKVELITPARFLFDNGNTPKQWNMKMLSDEHFKVIHFEGDGKKIFPNTDIKGGIAIHYRDITKNYGAIQHFTAFSELNSILKKVLDSNFSSLTTIMYNQNKFNLTYLYSVYPNLKNTISSNGKEKRLTSGCLVYDCFHDTKENQDNIKIIGVINNKRTYKYINSNFLESQHQNLEKFKVILPANNGSGAIGEVISTPLIGTPLIGTPLMGYTQTFISIGAFATENLANNTLKYVKSKFCRVMLGVLKVTQNGKRDVWKYVPLQDFTENSDIDWSKSIHEIDLQLYKKYNLDETEIEFIEKNVKEMS
jgi:type II restriction enzyme